MEQEAFRDIISSHLTGGEAAQLSAFLSLCSYSCGKYDDVAAFGKAVQSAAAHEGPDGEANRLFYFALPPAVFLAAAATVSANAAGNNGWTRLVVEKPFGRDSASSEFLSAELAKLFREDQIYRIDHYLGKEMVLNLMVLRFANSVFEPVWNRHYISTVQITFKEPFGVEGRGGYFDEVGIIRDIQQNHLLQVMSLVAMEPPISMSSSDIRDEKVKVLRATAPLDIENVVLGQYGESASGAKLGYLADTGVPADSTTPTFATSVLHVNNPRWAGVPFILKCGKALNERKAEIRIQFHSPPNALFKGAVGAAHNNELVIRIQPNEAVYLKMMCKMPGLEWMPAETELNLSYQTRYPTQRPPEAYARLILDVLRGDQSQFVRSDELAAAWAIFTPLLHRLEKEKIRPFTYPYGSRGPAQSDKLIRKCGYVYEGRYGAEWRHTHGPASAAGELARLRDEFTLSRDRLLAIMNHFLSEMEAGLAGTPSSIRMIPSFVTEVPTGVETGTIWAVDMGGSNLRVVEVLLRGGGVIEQGRQIKREIPLALMHAPAPALFDFVAAQLKEAGCADGDTTGFTFSFPVAQTAVNAGRLIAWTKGFSNAGAVDADVMALFSDACARQGVRPNLTALVNDTVGTLMSRAYSDPLCSVGVILGTGTNAAYVERTARISKWQGAITDRMLINMEWGAFGSGTAFSMLPFHAADNEMDTLTPNEGGQRYEKMISGMYLGELTRLLLVSLHSEGAVFAPTAATGDSVPRGLSRQLMTPWAVETRLLSTLSADTSPELDAVAAVLRDELGMPRSTLADRRIVQEVSDLVVRRAARLAAMGVAAVLTRMGPDGANAHVGIDGSVFKKHVRFQAWMEEALAELGAKCTLVMAEDGSGFGAAIVAKVSE